MPEAITTTLPLSAEITAKLRELRTMQKVSARILAERVSELGFPMTREMVANYECGLKKTLPLDYAVHAATALGSSLADLLGGDAACPTCHGEAPRGFTCNTCGGGQ